MMRPKVLSVILILLLCASTGCGWKRARLYGVYASSIELEASLSADSAHVDSLYNFFYHDNFPDYIGTRDGHPEISLTVAVTNHGDRMYVPLELTVHVMKNGLPIKDRSPIVSPGGNMKYAGLRDLREDAPVRNPCAATERYLQFMRDGETVTLVASEDVADFIFSRGETSPQGIYQFWVELSNICIRDAGPPVWTGRVFSDTVTFVITN